MKAIHVQYMLAAIFLLLGGWCVLFPEMVETLVLRPEYRIGNPTSQLLLACFGAQAMLVGTVICTCRFLPKTFLIFGLTASIPFFVFNVCFYVVRGMFTEWMLLDVVGNAGILACGLLGYRLALKESRQAPSSC